MPLISLFMFGDAEGQLEVSSLRGIGDMARSGGTAFV